MTIEHDLGGKLAVVTGGARGIGLASALSLARAGAAIAPVDVLDLGQAVSEIEATGARALPLQVDVSDRRALADGIRQLGVERIDILVTAAGIFGNTSVFEELDDVEVERVLGVNLKGTLWAIQAVLPLMMERGGKIVCVGSVAGQIGSIQSGAHYTASKGGVHAMVKWIAKRYAVYGIYANVVAPGVVETEMTRGKEFSPDYCPIGRLGTVEDVAGAVRFLASDASDYVTGTELSVNGGFFMG